MTFCMSILLDSNIFVITRVGIKIVFNSFLQNILYLICQLLTIFYVDLIICFYILINNQQC